MLDKNETSIIDYYQKELKKIVWRLQYHAKIKHKREVLLNDYLISTTPNHDEHECQLYIMDLIALIPYDMGKKILYEIYILDKTEKQIAKEMKISQQAVNKWKKKSLNYLYQNLSS